MSDDLQSVLQRMEASLYSSESEPLAEGLQRFLHDQYRELSPAGWILSKQQAIDSRIQKALQRKYHAEQFEMRVISYDVVQLLYYLSESCDSNHRTRCRLCSSLWKKTANGWQILYHQVSALDA